MQDKNQELDQFFNPNEEKQNINLEADSAVMQTVKYLLKKGISKAERRKLYKITPFKAQESLGRNEICNCGSGKKYKKCCLPRDEREKTLQKLVQHDQNLGLE